MFCHDKYFLAFCLQEKTARSYQLVRGNDGRDQREEREQVIACTMIEYAVATAGEKMASSANGRVDGEHQRCVRRSSMPDTSLPHASPYL
jgi:hypothetical protein